MNFTHEIFANFLDGLVNGLVDRDSALDWLEAAWKSLESDTNQLVEMVEESDYYELSPQEVDYGLTALSDYQEAVEAAYSYLSEDWDEGLQLAFDKAQEAQQKMVVAHDESKKFAEDHVVDSFL
jgi:tRNA A37 threonylcarbamoyladenosine synthetase subunit TsaC/SUA5/YrdC